MRLCYQVAAGLSHLHSLGLSHGALTSAAVRLDSDLNAKISGFDLARYAVGSTGPPPPPTTTKALAAHPSDARDAAAEAAANLASSMVGIQVAGYWAPEKWTDLTTLRLAGDIFALGCLIASVLIGVEPWEGKSAESIRSAVRACVRPPFIQALRGASTANPDQVAPDLLRLVEQCTASAPKDRPGIDEVLERLKGVLDFTKRKGERKEPSAASTELGIGSIGTDGASLGDFVSSSRIASPAVIRPNILKAKIELGAAGVSPLLREYSDGPPVDLCDASRERAYERFGTIDRKMLVGEQQPAVAMYIVHRSNGNIALATRGLADPPHSEPHNTTGIGLELWGEAAEKEVGTGQQLASSFLFQLMHEVPNHLFPPILMRAILFCRWRVTRNRSAFGCGSLLTSTASSPWSSTTYDASPSSLAVPLLTFAAVASAAAAVAAAVASAAGRRWTLRRCMWTLTRGGRAYCLVWHRVTFQSFSSCQAACACG